MLLGVISIYAIKHDIIMAKCSKSEKPFGLMSFTMERVDLQWSSAGI